MIPGLNHAGLKHKVGKNKGICENEERSAVDPQQRILVHYPRVHFAGPKRAKKRDPRVIADTRDRSNLHL